MPYVNERWLGGMLTNFDTISKRVGKMLEYERMRDSGEFEAMPKKEALLLTREMEKLQRNLGGLRGLDRRPDAIFVLDTKKEHIAVTEANKLGIPVVAVVDTNVDPELVQYPIPGNDDAIRANSLLARVIADAVEEGRYIAAKRDPGNAPVDAHRPSRRRRSPPSRPRPATPRPRAQAEREARLAAARDATPRRPSRRGAAAPRSCRPSPTPSPTAEPEPPTPTAVDEPVAEAAGRRVEHHRHRHPRRRRRHARRDRDRRDRGELMAFTAKDVQALRQATGAGMMDAKKALEANDGDMEAAKQWLREQGLAASAKRDDRENTQGVVALVVDDQVGAMVELKCETDFVAGSEHFKLEAQELAHARRRQGRRRRRRAARTASRTSRSRSRRRSSSGASCASRPAPATSSTATCTSRAAAASTACSSCCPAATPSSPTTSPCTSPSPARSTSPATTSPPTSSRPSGPRWRRSPATRASPSRRCGKIVEGRLQRVLQDGRPARPALRQGRQADRSASSSATATIVDFAQVEIG